MRFLRLAAMIMGDGICPSRGRRYVGGPTSAAALDYRGWEQTPEPGVQIFGRRQTWDGDVQSVGDKSGTSGV